MIRYEHPKFREELDLQIIEAIKWNEKHEISKNNTTFGISKMIGRPEEMVKRITSQLWKKGKLIKRNSFFYTN